MISIKTWSELTIIMQAILAKSHNLYEKGDQCVEIDLEALDRVRDFLVKHGLQYHYEAEGWKMYLEEEK